MFSKTTEILIRKGWIGEQDRQWGEYVLVKITGIVVYFTTCMLIAVLFQKILEMLLFILVIYSLRSRMGGCHAKTLKQCLTASILLTLIMVFPVASAVQALYGKVLGIVGIILYSLTFRLKPIYPGQLHFTDEIRAKNNRKKNYLLGLILMFHMVISSVNFHYFVYPLLGIGCVLTGVMVENYKQKKEKDANEKKRKCMQKSNEMGGC